uniref:Bardet-Biedl syndrome 1 N-terminal domain-containing protein n=1 Tax=Trichuris muris TaxID=70415 RepID=A0A5S6QRI9_TRIMR
MDAREIQLDDVKANYGEMLLSEFKRSVNKVTVSDLQTVAESQVTTRLFGKGCPHVVTPNWEASAIRCAEMLRPIDICVMPDGTIIVADAEAGLLMFNSQKCLINKVAGLQVRSVCYHPIYLCIVAAVPNEQKAKFYDRALTLKREQAIPHADPWLQIRCTEMGTLFCATYDAWTYSVHLHCCLDEKEWRTFAILQDSVQQFFGITLLPATNRRCQNLAKLLLVTDTGNMYEITVERLAGTVLKQMRPIKIEQLDLESSTSITTTDHESIVIVDNGIFYEISNKYKVIKSIGSVGSKAMVTGLAISDKVLYATICNRRCIASFNLKQ